MSRPAPLSLADRERLKGKVLALVCSEAWADEVTSAAEAAGLRPGSAHLRKDLARLGIYPPADPVSALQPGRPSLMVRCSRCDSTWYPPQYVWHVQGEHVCEDCRQMELLPAKRRNLDFSRLEFTTDSPTAQVLDAMMRSSTHLQEQSVRGDRVRDRLAPTDDVGELLEEIRIYDETGWVVEVYANPSRGERRVVYVKRDDEKIRAIEAAAAAPDIQPIAAVA